MALVKVKKHTVSVQPHRLTGHLVERQHVLCSAFSCQHGCPSVGSLTSFFEKAIPVVRRVRKATGLGFAFDSTQRENSFLKKTAELPRVIYQSLEMRLGFFSFIGTPLFHEHIMACFDVVSAFAFTTDPKKRFFFGRLY
jgi:hypothetical protein